MDNSSKTNTIKHIFSATNLNQFTNNNNNHSYHNNNIQQHQQNEFVLSNRSSSSNSINIFLNTSGGGGGGGGNTHVNNSQYGIEEIDVINGIQNNGNYYII